MPSREELRQATHEQVMAAAEELFGQRGFKRTTIRDIAEFAGVSVGTVMGVGDKNALLVAMFDRAISEMHQRPSATPQESDADASKAPLEEIMGTIQPFLSLFAAHMDLARDYGAILMSGNHTSVVFDELAGTLTTEIERILEESGLLSAHVPVAAKTIYLAYLGTIFAWAGSGSSGQHRTFTQSSRDHRVHNTNRRKLD